MIRIQSDNGDDACCKRKGVPRNCIGICMGGCKDTPWETYKLVPKNNACHKHEKAAKECCEEDEDSSEEND